MKISTRCFYWDSSALIKRYIVENGTKEVDKLLSADDCRHITSVVTHAEIVATLYRLLRENRVSAHENQIQTKAFLTDWSRWLFVPYSHQVQAVAQEAAVKAKLKGADLIHLATAIWLESENLELEFVSFDNRLIYAVKECSSIPLVFSKA